MRKSFKVNGLDCPKCAARLEKGINKIEGCDEAVVAFATQKLTLEADDAVFDKVLDEAAALCKKLEPDWEIVR